MGSAVDAGIIQSAELARCYRHGVSQTAWFPQNSHTGIGAIYGSSGTCAVMRSPSIQSPLPDGIPHRRFCEVTKQPPDFYREKPENILIGHSVSSYSDYFIWHSAFLGIVSCELGASACAVPESKKKIAIINYLHIPYDRCTFPCFL